MLIDTTRIVHESLVGASSPTIQPAPRPLIKLTAEQRTRLEFVLKKLRIFGEINHYHNAAFIDCLLNSGEDRRAQFSPSTDCLAVVDNIIHPEAERPIPVEEPAIPAFLPALAAD